MFKARRIAKRFSAELELISAASKMAEAVEVALERAGRVPTLAEGGVQRACLRLGRPRPGGRMRDRLHRSKIFGTTKDGREGTEARLNRPLIQRACAREEEGSSRSLSAVC
jgi:hypothetical protein